jgi:glycosyltransferase involved in cell wall biosynthesis
MEGWQEEGVVNYLGASDNVKSIIAKSDCVVLPSYREGLSRVLLEASSMAKPIVTTNVPGCKDVVVDGLTGYLCEVKDPQSLATQMMKIISMTQNQRLKMGIKGREKMIAEFDEKFVVDKYLEGVTFLSDGMALT